MTEFKIHKVIGAHDIDQYTKAGWSIEEAFFQDEPAIGSDPDRSDQEVETVGPLDTSPGLGRRCIGHREIPEVVFVPAVRRLPAASVRR